MSQLFCFGIVYPQKCDICSCVTQIPLHMFPKLIQNDWSLFLRVYFLKRFCLDVDCKMLYLGTLEGHDGSPLMYSDPGD